MEQQPQLPRKFKGPISEKEFSELPSDQQSQIAQTVHMLHFRSMENQIVRLMNDLMQGRLIHAGTGQVMQAELPDAVLIVATVNDPITPEPIRQKLLAEDKKVDVSVEFRENLIAYMKSVCGPEYQPAIKKLSKRPPENCFYAVCFDFGRCSVAEQEMGTQPIAQPSSEERSSDDLGPPGGDPPKAA